MREPQCRNTLDAKSALSYPEMTGDDLTLMSNVEEKSSRLFYSMLVE